MYYRWDPTTQQYTIAAPEAMASNQPPASTPSSSSSSSTSSSSSSSSSSSGSSSTSESDPSGSSGGSEEKVEELFPGKKKPKVTAVKFSIKAAKVSSDLQRWTKKADEASLLTDPAAGDAPSPSSSPSPSPPDMSHNPNASLAAAAPLAANRGSPNAGPHKEREAPAPMALPPSSEPSQLSPDGFLDYGRKACLLCQRGFKTLEKLNQHVELSDLHKKNLEIETYRQVQRDQQAAVAAALRQEMSYRKPDPEYEPRKKNHKKRPSESKSSVDRPIDTSNKGNRMLKNMGWQEGQGLGRSGSGIVAPIQAESYSKNAGLGLKENVGLAPGETYQSAAKKKARLRYETAADLSAPEATDPELVLGSAYLDQIKQYQSRSCADDGMHQRPLMK
eukprot:TRINITY_DN2042_c0_g1_i1.p1 TRINITY_DN2042_c0_g1~~TRINITY_DN2042_c0_g1_i1.p1  ORF type:complete len:443 (+),score=165.53 TRINITY_DN2042_c0_g1_i1:160-1329(+)